MNMELLPAWLLPRLPDVVESGRRLIKGVLQSEGETREQKILRQRRVDKRKERERHKRRREQNAALGLTTKGDVRRLDVTRGRR